MTKLILLALVISFHSFAQVEEELTLEDPASPTIVEDGSDFSAEPNLIDTPDTVDVSVNSIPDTAPVDDEVATTPMVEEIPAPEEKAVVVQEPPKEVSTPVITTEAPRDDRFIEHRKSHWLATFGFESMKYELPWNFKGERKNIPERDQELYGGRLGFGGQLYLGGGFFTNTIAEAYYLGTFTKTIQVGDPAVEDAEAGTLKRTGGVWGGEVAQQLGFMVEIKTKNPFMDEWSYLTIEPFVEAGLGVARAYHSVDYNYDTTGTSGPGVKEAYKVRLRDQLTNARIGAGFNMTSRSGFFFQAKATINRYDITDRKIDGSRLLNGQTNITKDPSVRDKDAKIDPITVFSIGGGYKF